MSGVFLSFAAADRAYADRVADWLERAGFDVTGRQLTNPYADLVRQQLNACEAVVVVLSPAAESSRQVRHELARAGSRKVPILPLLLAGAAYGPFVEVACEDVTGGGMPSSAFFDRLSAVVVADISDDDSDDDDVGPVPLVARQRIPVLLAVLLWPLFILCGGSLVTIVLQTVHDPGSADDLTVSLQATAALAAATLVVGTALYIGCYRRSLRIDAEGITRRSWLRTAHLPWSAIADAAITDGQLTVAARPGSALAAHPRRGGVELVSVTGRITVCQVAGLRTTPDARRAALNGYLRHGEGRT